MATERFGQQYREVAHQLFPSHGRAPIASARNEGQTRPVSPTHLHKSNWVTDEETDRLSNTFADALAARGVQRGDRVAFLMPQCSQLAVCRLGLWKVGAAVVPINPLCTEEELSRALVKSRATIAVVFTLLYHKIRVVQPQTKLRRIIVTNGRTICYARGRDVAGEV